MLIKQRPAAVHNNHHVQDDRAVKTVLLCLWIMSSVLGILVNKRLMKSMSFPMTLTVLHNLVTFVCDLIVISRRSTLADIYRNVVSWELIARAIVVGALSAFSKALTLFAYGKLSLSLAHTLKSSSPIFAAAISFVLFRSRLSLPQVGALCTICFGVALSSLTEIHCEFSGLLAALAACMIGVCSSVVVKDTISSLHCEPLVFHLLNTGAAMMVITPPAIVYEAGALLGFRSDKADPSELLDATQRNSLILLSLLCHYGATIGSFLSLAKLPVLNHQVANVGKRLSVIIISILTFGNPVTPVNVLGMATAMFGFAWFIFIRRRSETFVVPLSDTPLGLWTRKLAVRCLSRWTVPYLPLSHQSDDRI